MASILDVAREANVAPSTVSLVANGHPRVAQETRQRVEQAIKRMGYRSRSARKKKQHIGVLYARGMVINNELADYCRQWIRGIRQSFGDKGADVSVNVGEEHIDRDFMFGRGLEKGDFDGLVLMGVQPRDGYLERALQTRLPLVVMSQSPEHSEFSSVCADAYAAGRLAAEHLLGLGHRRIATVIPRHLFGPAVGLRAGFTDVLVERDMPAALDLVDEQPLRFEDPATFDPRARHLIEAGATACFCGDPAALRLADALADRGVDVPERFSLLGWDDLGFTTRAGRRLTSIGYDKFTMGLLAGQMLQNLLTMKARVTNLAATVPVKLTPGQTTGSCPEG